MELREKLKEKCGRCAYLRTIQEADPIPYKQKKRDSDWRQMYSSPNEVDLSGCAHKDFLIFSACLIAPEP